MVESFIYSRTIEILVSMVIGAFLCWLGYRLFFVRLADKTDMKIEYNSIKFNLLGASPGIFFVLFGSVLISLSVVKMAKYEEKIQHGFNDSVSTISIEKSANEGNARSITELAEIVRAYNTAQKLHVNGKFAEAEDQYKKILHSIPELEKIINNFADLKNNQGEKVQALTSAKFGKIIYPDSNLLDGTIREIEGK